MHPRGPPSHQLRGASAVMQMVARIQETKKRLHTWQPHFLWVSHQCSGFAGMHVNAGLRNGLFAPGRTAYALSRPSSLHARWQRQEHPERMCKGNLFVSSLMLSFCCCMHLPASGVAPQVS